MKNMIFLISLIALIQCTAPGDKTNMDQSPSIAVSVDSLNALFVAGWNNRDSAAIMATLAPDAIVMNDSMIHKGKEAIANNWVSGGVKVLSNIVTTSLFRKGSDALAYDGGTYTANLTIPNGPVLKERGNYSLVWTKQTDGQWLLSLVHLEDVTRLPDIQ